MTVVDPGRERAKVSAREEVEEEGENIDEEAAAATRHQEQTQRGKSTIPRATGSDWGSRLPRRSNGG